MWLVKLFAPVTYFRKPVFCEKHNSLESKDVSDEERKQSEEIFCVLAYIRKRVMDPFYFKTPYPSTVLGKKFKELEKLPWESSISWDKLEEEIDLVQFIHDVATYTLAALTKVCIFCDKSKANFLTWVSNTKEETDLWHILKDESVDFKTALASSSHFQKILDEMNSHKQLTSKDYKMVDTIFFVTFMIKYSVFSSESVESILASNQKIKEHTKKFTLKFPIGEDRLKVFEELSQYLLTLKGDEKESFSILLELVKRAEMSLKLKKYKETEIYGHAIVTLVPSWCKGYYYLSSAVHHRSERVPFTCMYATFALMNCDDVFNCSTCHIQLENWKQKDNFVCPLPPEKLTAENCRMTEENFNRASGEKGRKNLYGSEADDVPELTDPSSSDESHSESESDYDAAVEEMPELRQLHLGEKLMKTDTPKEDFIVQSPVRKESDSNDLQRQSPVKKDNSEQRGTSELKQQSSEIMEEHDLKENLSITQQSPPKKKSISEQNEVAKPSSKAVKEVELKPPKSNPKKVEKARNRKGSAGVALSAIEILEKLERFKILLREGSAALTDGCGLSAVRNFYDALSELKTHPDVYKLEEYEIVDLKYAYGSGCCKSGTYEDLNKALVVFNEILNDHPTVRFPVAHYGLGLAHLKLNRFKEALTHFENLQSMIDKGIQCTVHTWPGTVTAIEETKKEKLKVLLNDLVGKCRSPPSPAAVCRHENCLSRPEIYYSDPDFKGFTVIQCQDRCVLQYHPLCWKTLKDALNRTDKDFLGQHCLTPDCEFIIMQIECIGKDGNSEKHFEIEDNEKVKKHKKSRLEKKLVMKEQKKRRRLESQNTTVSENAENCDSIEDELTSESIPVVTDQPSVKETESNEIVENEGSKKIESNLSANAKPFYVKKDGEPVKENVKACYMWKRDAESEKEKVCKIKERKKPKKPAALSLEEFRQKIQDFSYYSEYQTRLHRLQENNNEDIQTHWSTICETEKIPHLDPNRPFYIPEDLRNDPITLDAVLRSYSSHGQTDFSKVLRERIYQYLEKILTLYGPMRVDDPFFQEEISVFPAAFQQMISDAGGLKEFLLASMRFAFVGDHICVVSDVVKAYSLGSKPYNGEYSHGCDKVDEYEELCNGLHDEDDFDCDNKFHSRLNPNATEYNPVSPVQSTKSSISSGNSNCSSEAYQNDISMKEMERDCQVGSTSSSVSSLSKLREPTLSNGQSSSDLKKNDSNDLDPLCRTNLNGKFEASADASFFFADPRKAFERLAEDIAKLPDEKKFDMILKVLKFALNDEYYADNISLFNQHLKPFTFSLAPKKQSKCLQAGTPDINMHSKGVMKEDEHIKALIEKFHDLEQFRNNINEEKKAVEDKLEHALDTIVQLQNALAVAEKNKEKKVEEIQSLLQEEKKEFKKKEKNWEKEQKRFELNQAKISEQLKICKEEMKKLKEELAKKDVQLKEVEELKKATELGLEKESKAKTEVETSLHAALQFHETEVSTLTKKLQSAQLEILTIKKSNVLEKISVATKNAELRLKEIQDGLPVVNHPLFLEQFNSLQTQIKEHILKLGKAHCDYVKAADEQINELKKGKDLSDLPPLADPTLSECPALKVPTNVSTSMAQGINNLAPGSSTSQAHPNPNFANCWNSFGMTGQISNSSSTPSGGQIYSSLWNPFPQNSKLITPQQSPNFHGAPGVGNVPSLGGSNIPNVNHYPMQNLGMAKSSSLFDPPLYPNTTSGYFQKPSPNSFQLNLPRSQVPPGLSVPAHSSSSGLPDSLAQTSGMFGAPQNLQQNASGTQSLLQTPFSFGFPQLHNRAPATQLNASATEKSSAEMFLKTLMKTGTQAEGKSLLDSEAHSEKSASKENDVDTKSNVSNPTVLDSVVAPTQKGSRANSSCSSPIPIQSSRDQSNKSDSPSPTPAPSSEPVSASSQPPAFDLEATGVKQKQPIANAKKKKMIGGSSRSGTSSVVSDYDLDGSVPEGSALELGYTVKETEETPEAKFIPPSSSVAGFAKAVKAPAPQPKNVPTTNSYEKLLSKLMAAYPQCSRTELTECVGEFRRSNNNKLSNLKFGNIITGIGEILERRKNNLTQTSQKKKPQLQVISLTKKPAPPPPPPEKSGICPWAKAESQSTSATWNTDNADTICSICLEDMTHRCSVKKLECGHRFHLLCLKEWLGKNSNCPICRVHVLLPEDYPSLT